MCGRYILTQKIEKLESRFNASAKIENEWHPSYNISPGKFAPVIINKLHQQIQLLQFGLTPFWAKKTMYLFNARAEGDRNKDNNPNFSGSKEIINKPAFRKPIRSQRCLVPADAFIEGTSLEGLDKPYLIFLRNKQRPFAFAGIYDEWKNLQTGELVIGFSIVTTTANKLLQMIPHHRSPVILRPDQEQKWLNPNTPLSDITAMLKPFNSELMNAYSISKQIKNHKNDYPELIQPTAEPLLDESNPDINTILKQSGFGRQGRSF